MPHRRSSSLLLPLLLLSSACQREGPRQAEQEPTPAPVTAAQFRSLAWLEGRWRGTDNDTAAFYEAYRFVDDSTLRTYTFTDSTLRQVADSGAIRLSGGTVMAGNSTAGWVVTALDSGKAHFKPVGRAVNAFTWQRQADGSWLATLTWRDNAGQPMERVYVMRPYGR